MPMTGAKTYSTKSLRKERLDDQMSRSRLPFFTRDGLPILVEGQPVLESSNLKQAMHMALQCHTFNAGTIVYVVGASGAGKSVLSQVISRIGFGPSETWQLGRIPFIGTTAENPDKGFYSSRYMFSDIAGQLADPFRTTAIQLNEAVAPDLRLAVASMQSQMSMARTTEAEFRKTSASIARACGLVAVHIDEANMISFVNRARLGTDHIESLRTFGLRSGARIFLFGTVDLLGLAKYSAQINRNCRIILIDRIRASTKDEVHEFMDLLEHFESRFSLRRGLLSERARLIHNNTLGIPGEVVAVIERALMMAAGQGTEVEWENVEDAFPRPIELKRLKDEVDEIDELLEGQLKECVMKTSATRSKPKARARRWEVPRDV